ncbi:unnamed protein product [Amoebophrya sp. A120]|nr:unnamed protein product [Amoebophrya sp. A120]|eukprot:GSA120T00000627001.1
MKGLADAYKTQVGNNASSTANTSSPAAPGPAGTPSPGSGGPSPGGLAGMNMKKLGGLSKAASGGTPSSSAGPAGGPPPPKKLAFAMPPGAVGAATVSDDAAEPNTTSKDDPAAQDEQRPTTASSGSAAENAHAGATKVPAMSFAKLAPGGKSADSSNSTNSANAPMTNPFGLLGAAKAAGGTTPASGDGSGSPDESGGSAAPPPPSGAMLALMGKAPPPGGAKAAAASNPFALGGAKKSNPFLAGLGGGGSPTDAAGSPPGGGGGTTTSGGATPMGFTSAMLAKKAAARIKEKSKKLREERLAKIAALQETPAATNLVKERRAMRNRKDLTPLQKIVVSPKFDAFVTFAIAANCFFMAFEYQLQGEDKVDMETGIIVGDLLFLLIFTAELGLRCGAFGLKNVIFNLQYSLDVAVVGSGILFELLLPLITTGGISTGGEDDSGGLADVMRMLRVLRALRVLRLLTIFEHLWAVVQLFFFSIPPLIWTVSFMMIIIFLFAMFSIVIIGQNTGLTYRGNSSSGNINSGGSSSTSQLVTATGSCNQNSTLTVQVAAPTSPNGGDEGSNSKKEQFDEAKQFFMTTRDAIVYMFRIMTLDGWSDIVVPLAQDSVWPYIYFLLFISISGFGLMNLVTVTVLETAQKQTKRVSELLDIDDKMNVIGDLLRFPNIAHFAGMNNGENNANGGDNGGSNANAVGGGAAATKNPQGTSTASGNVNQEQPQVELNVTGNTTRAYFIEHWQKSVAFRNLFETLQLTSADAGAFFDAMDLDSSGELDPFELSTTYMELTTQVLNSTASVALIRSAVLPEEKGRILRSTMQVAQASRFQEVAKQNFLDEKTRAEELEKKQLEETKKQGLEAKIREEKMSQNLEKILFEFASLREQLDRAETKIADLTEYVTTELQAVRQAQVTLPPLRRRSVKKKKAVSAGQEQSSALESVREVDDDGGNDSLIASAVGFGEMSDSTLGGGPGDTMMNTTTSTVSGGPRVTNAAHSPHVFSHSGEVTRRSKQSLAAQQQQLQLQQQMPQVAGLRIVGGELFVQASVTSAAAQPPQQALLYGAGAPPDRGAGNAGSQALQIEAGGGNSAVSSRPTTAPQEVVQRGLSSPQTRLRSPAPAPGAVTNGPATEQAEVVSPASIAGVKNNSTPSNTDTSPISTLSTPPPAASTPGAAKGSPSALLGPFKKP